MYCCLSILNLNRRGSWPCRFLFRRETLARLSSAPLLPLSRYNSRTFLAVLVASACTESWLSLLACLSPHTQSFSLDYNQIEGDFTPGWFSLNPALHLVSISHNRVTSLPDDLWTMPMRSLDISFNQLSGEQLCSLPIGCLPESATDSPLCFNRRASEHGRSFSFRHPAAVPCTTHAHPSSSSASIAYLLCIGLGRCQGNPGLSAPALPSWVVVQSGTSTKGDADSFFCPRFTSKFKDTMVRSLAHSSLNFTQFLLLGFRCSRSTPRTTIMPSAPANEVSNQCLALLVASCSRHLIGFAASVAVQAPLAFLPTARSFRRTLTSRRCLWRRFRASTPINSPSPTRPSETSACETRALELAQSHSVR